MNNRRNLLAGIALAAGLALSGAIAHAQATTQTPSRPDNTKVNTRDRAKDAKTADQQSNAKSDLNLTRQIRRAIVADKTLSTYAHNVKVIARGGKVTLKGPVHTAEEKSALEAKAVEIAGAGNVSNQIDVMAGNAKKTRTSSGKDR